MFGRTATSTLLLPSSRSAPAIILTFPDTADVTRRRAARRCPPPSPHLLCVGWRRRPDSFPDPYGLIGDSGDRARSSLTGLSSASISGLAALSRLSTFSLASWSAALTAMFAFVSMSMAQARGDKNSLPFYRPPQRRTNPVALFALFLAVLVGLTLAIHSSFIALESPLVSHHNYYSHHKYNSRFAATHMRTHRALPTHVSGNVGVVLPRQWEHGSDTWHL